MQNPWIETVNLLVQFWSQTIPGLDGLADEFGYIYAFKTNTNLVFKGLALLLERNNVPRIPNVSDADYVINFLASTLAWNTQFSCREQLDTIDTIKAYCNSIPASSSYPTHILLEASTTIYAIRLVFRNIEASRAEGMDRSIEGLETLRNKLLELVKAQA